MFPVSTAHPFLELETIPVDAGRLGLGLPLRQHWDRQILFPAVGFVGLRIVMLFSGR